MRSDDQQTYPEPVSEGAPSPQLGQHLRPDEVIRTPDSIPEANPARTRAEAPTVAAAPVAAGDELPVPPWTATPEHDPASRSDSAPAGEPDAPGPRAAFLRRAIPGRTWAIAGISTLLAASLFGGGCLVGARDPLLAPVRISPGPATVGLSAAERVYATVKDSVVTVQVPGGGTGSGFFYRPDRIVTNDHVVASSTEVLKELALDHHPKVTIALSDGRVRDARVLAVDPRIDLAILSTPPGLGVRPLAFGDSADLATGEPAFVVGSPFGLATSINSGIISGIDRSSQFAADPVQSQLIQTDAAVNPGNSGGPLLDQTAAVVGIVTLRPDEADGRTTQGLAFALPSDVVVAAIDQLERYGSASHPQLGVMLDSPDPDDAGERGAVIVDVVEGSPADEAGLRVDDQLLAVDGRPTHDAASVIDALVGRRAGDSVHLTVLRTGDRFTVTLKLRERPPGS